MHLPRDPDRFSDPVADFISRIGLKWWGGLLIGIAVFGVGEKLLLPVLQGYLVIGGELSDWRPDIEALLNGFLLVPAIFAAYVWQIDGVRDVWIQFSRNPSFENQEEGFTDFMKDAAHSFRQPWWLLSVAVTIIGVLVQALWLWDAQNPKPVEPWWVGGEPLARVVALTLAVPGWYAASQIVVGQARLAHGLNRLWSRLGAGYRLGSKGGTGGVASLSRSVAIITTVGAIVLLNIVLGVLLPRIRAEEATPDFFLWALIIWVAYLIVVPGILLLLLWPAHRVMDEKRSERIESVVELIDKRYEDAEQAVEVPGEGGDAVKALSNLRELRDWLESDLPAWPIPDPLRVVSWSTVVPISLTILTIVLDRIA